MKILIGLLGVGAMVLLGRGYYRFCRDLAEAFISQEAGLKKSIQKGGDEKNSSFDLECGFEANHRLGYKEFAEKHKHDAIIKLL